ncbi:response regulator transcription factor [Paenibacillus lemnae]|uniref:Response regulator transcription factor n=1 Tax=Paenibacillus lemnae TaxID=1330551 RepID=A0A848M2Y2_PAELE|nr:response regulator transcription factor [Paenibacillus lemnae]NMO94590.1 response regulator transcription factor [Paenibacillus lemnae]
MQSTPVVLIADDEAEIRDVLHVYLRNEGYMVLEAENGLEVLQTLEQEKPDVIIMDVMMPQMDGITTCIKIREHSNIPIIILSAKETQLDKITGLSIGADDYVTKPFHPLELMARVKVQLRRHSDKKDDQKSTDILRIGELMIDIPQHEVSIQDRQIKLTPLEFSILKLLASHRGQVFSVDRIYESVWKEPASSSEQTVMVHIRNLREKLEVDPRHPKYIKTVWGVGYKIEK